VFAQPHEHSGGTEAQEMPLLDQTQEEYNIAHTLNALVRILDNATLAAYHVETVDAVSGDLPIALCAALCAAVAFAMSAHAPCVFSRCFSS
jgi:hypothetical protein